MEIPLFTIYSNKRFFWREDTRDFIPERSRHKTLHPPPKKKKKKKKKTSNKKTKAKKSKTKNKSKKKQKTIRKRKREEKKQDSLLDLHPLGRFYPSVAFYNFRWSHVALFSSLSIQPPMKSVDQNDGVLITNNNYRYILHEGSDHKTKHKTTTEFLAVLE